MNTHRSPLRILQVNSLFSGGGTDNQTLQLALGLRELGEDVTLAIPRGSRWELLARQPVGMHVETFSPRSPLKTAMIWKLIALLREPRIQIIHAHQGRDYWPAIFAARLTGRGARVVVTRHLMTRPRALSRALLLRMSDVVAVSRAVQGVLGRELRGPRRRLHQIYGGIDLQAFQPGRTPAASAFRRQHGWPDDAVLFGVIGAYHAPCGKGQLVFLEAAARLKAECPQARFAIVGKGEIGPLLRERAAGLGLEGLATVTPFVDDIAPVVNALDVLVHPVQDMEALGLVLWEAMACAKPVIASQLDGIPEAFVDGQHGFLVPPGNATVLAEAMRALLNDPARRDRFGTAGREWVCRNFSRETLARRVRELYCQLLSPE